MTSPHDRPTADELLESVREWLERDVAKSTDPRVAFHARVAANIIEMVRRENDSLEQMSQHYNEVLGVLGVTSEQELVDSIRNGDYDHNLLKLLQALRPVVENKVLVANPKYLY